MKISLKKSTIHNLIFEYSSVLVVIVQGLLLVPFYLKYIPIGLYGAWLASGGILSVIAIVDPGVSMVLLQKISVAYGKENYDEICSYFLSGLIITSLVVLIIVVVGTVILPFLPDLLRIDSSVDIANLKKAFEIAIIGTALTIFSFSVSATCKGLQASLSVGWVSLITNILSILLTMYLLFSGFELIAIAGAIFARGVGLTVGSTYCLFWRFKVGNIPFTFSFEKVRELISLTMFTFWGRIGVTLCSSMDSFLIARYLGADIVPLYTLSKRGPDTCRVFVERPTNAFMPAISQLVGEGNIVKAREILIRLMRLVFWLLGLISCGFIAYNDDFMRLWVGKELFVGTSINLIIVLTFFFSVFARSCANLCMALGDIKKNNLVILWESLIYIIFIAITIKPLGIWGVALAPLVANFSLPIIYYPYSLTKRIFLSKVELREISLEFFKAIVVMFILLLFFIRVSPAGWVYFVLWVGAFCACYLLGILVVSHQARIEVKIITKRFFPSFT